MPKKQSVAARRRSLAAKHAKHHTRETRDALIEAYVPVMHIVLAHAMGARRLKTLSSYRPLHDELISASYLALVEAAEDWRHDLGLAFSTWLYWKTKHTAVETLRKETGLPKRRAAKGQRIMSLDGLLENEDAGRDMRTAGEYLTTHPMDRTLVQDRLRRVAAVLVGLDDDKQRIVHHVLSGQDTAEIAKSEGLSRSRVRAIVREAFREARRELG